MIAIIDYGAGNLRSIRRALETNGAETTITSDPDVVRQADAVAKPFHTLYYTAHLHAGVLVAPPFVAAALGD